MSHWESGSPQLLTSEQQHNLMHNSFFTPLSNISHQQYHPKRKMRATPDLNGTQPSRLHNKRDQIHPSLNLVSYVPLYIKRKRITDSVQDNLLNPQNIFGHDGIKELPFEFHTPTTALSLFQHGFDMMNESHEHFVDLGFNHDQNSKNSQDSLSFTSTVSAEPPLQENSNDISLASNALQLSDLSTMDSISLVTSNSLSKSSPLAPTTNTLQLSQPIPHSGSDPFHNLIRSHHCMSHPVTSSRSRTRNDSSSNNVDDQNKRDKFNSFGSGSSNGSKQQQKQPRNQHVYKRPALFDKTLKTAVPSKKAVHHWVRNPSIVWYRGHDLRTEDHPALLAAAQRGGPVIPIFIMAQKETVNVDPACWWLESSLQNLGVELRNLGAQLIIRRGDTLAELRNIIEETESDAVFWNRSYDPVLLKRDEELRADLISTGITAESFKAELLVEPWELKSDNDCEFRKFQLYMCAWMTLPPPPLPLPPPGSLVGYSRPLKSIKISRLNKKKNQEMREMLEKEWKPGSVNALNSLDNFLTNTFLSYGESRCRRDLQGTSRLSPHLHFGELSPRRLYHAVRSRAAKRDPHNIANSKAGISQAARAFLKNICLRDYSYHLLFHHPNLSDTPLVKDFNVFPWLDNPIALEAWKKGETGYPIVDAARKQLKAIGWLHNTLRYMLASFLSKFLLCPWQKGVKDFFYSFIDGDLASNSLGWQWVTGCNSDSFSVQNLINPVGIGQRQDPSGFYIRQWLPVLKDLPIRYIHCPWKAPPQVLKEAGVVLGDNYPFPIIDLSVAQARLKNAFAIMEKNNNEMKSREHKAETDLKARQLNDQLPYTNKQAKAETIQDFGEDDKAKPHFQSIWQATAENMPASGSNSKSNLNNTRSRSDFHSEEYFVDMESQPILMPPNDMIPQNFINYSWVPSPGHLRTGLSYQGTLRNQNNNSLSMGNDAPVGSYTYPIRKYHMDSGSSQSRGLHFNYAINDPMGSQPSLSHHDQSGYHELSQNPGAILSKSRSPGVLPQGSQRSNTLSLSNSGLFPPMFAFLTDTTSRYSGEMIGSKGLENEKTATSGGQGSRASPNEALRPLETDASYGVNSMGVGQNMESPMKLESQKTLNQSRSDDIISGQENPVDTLSLAESNRILKTISEDTANAYNVFTNFLDKN